MAPERIELTLGLAVEGLTPDSTVQAWHGQNMTSSGERGSGQRKRREKKPPRPMLPNDETPPDLSELSSLQAADQEREPESEPDLERRQGQEQNDIGAPHRIDSLA
jgi:hypothetical protein